jgi:DNA invertase Pin-like site-specific DNA recombinase
MEEDDQKEKVQKEDLFLGKMEGPHFDKGTKRSSFLEKEALKVGKSVKLNILNSVQAKKDEISGFSSGANTDVYKTLTSLDVDELIKLASGNNNLNKIRSIPTEKITPLNGNETMEDLLRIIHRDKDIDVSGKRCYGYIRCSTIMQLDKWSLPVQEQQIKEYCVKNGYNLISIFRDEGISGKDYKNREGLNNLLSIVKSFDSIITVSLSRISRNWVDFKNVYDDMKERNVSVVLMDLDIDTNNSTGRFVLDMLSRIAQLERETTSDRVKHTLNSMSKNGTLRTKPRFGYQVVTKEEIIKDAHGNENIIKKRETVEHLGEQATIRLIKQLREIDDMTVAEISEKFYRQQIRSKNGKRLWPETIKRIMIANSIK